MSAMLHPYEYELTFLQLACNPIALLGRRMLFSLISFMLVAIALTATQVNLMMILIASSMMLCTIVISWLPLFLGRGGYSTDKVFLEFAPGGLRTSFGGIVIEPSVAGVPYRFLSLQHGLIGCSVIHNVNGGYVIVPKRILAYEDLVRLLERLKGSSL